MTLLKEPFVIDKNVIITACQLSDPSGVKDISCNKLLDKINEKCHNVYLTQEIFNEFSRRVDTMEKKHINTVPAIRLLGLWKKIGKLKIAPPPDITINTVSNIKDDDLRYVKLALNFNAILVTYDGPLTKECEKVNCKVMEPLNALQFLETRSNSSER